MCLNIIEQILQLELKLNFPKALLSILLTKQYFFNNSKPILPFFFFFICHGYIKTRLFTTIIIR